MGSENYFHSLQNCFHVRRKYKNAEFFFRQFFLRTIFVSDSPLFFFNSDRTGFLYPRRSVAVLPGFAVGFSPEGLHP